MDGCQTETLLRYKCKFINREGQIQKKICCFLSPRILILDGKVELMLCMGSGENSTFILNICNVIMYMYKNMEKSQNFYEKITNYIYTHTDKKCILNKPYKNHSVQTTIA